MTDTETSETPEQQPVATATATDYWSQGAENLKGTISSLSLTGLHKSKATTEPDAEKENDEKEEKPKGGYWHWQENIKKTLSTVSLGNLVKTNNEKTHGDADDEVRPEPKQNYWFWKQSHKSKLDLLDGEEQQAAPAKNNYWFWRNSSASLDKQAELQDAPDANKDDSSPKKSGGPISQLEHKMRNSWRKSFQNLSSNSLTKLDEGETSAQPTGWKENFRSFRESFHNMQVSGSSHKIDEDATAAGVSLDEEEKKGDNSEGALDDDSSSEGISF